MMDYDRAEIQKAQTIAAFKVYGMEELENMNWREFMEEARKWMDWDRMAIAIGRPEVLQGLVLKIAELRRENAMLRRLIPKPPCEYCGDTGLIPTKRAVAGPGEKDEIVAYGCQPCHKCGRPIIRLEGKKDAEL